jgi:hypothetical protein
MMNRLLTGTFVAFALASGPAFACAEPPAAHVAHAAEAKPKAAAAAAKLKLAETAAGAKSRTVQPAATKPKAADPAAEAMFETADADDSGALEGAEVEAYKPAMAQIDTNKDGKVSREEFAAAIKAGTIR